MSGSRRFCREFKILLKAAAFTSGGLASCFQTFHFLFRVGYHGEKPLPDTFQKAFSTKHIRGTLVPREMQWRPPNRQ
jgi:hypothetical protein